MHDLSLPLGMKGLRQSGIFKGKFHQQKLIWIYLLEKILLSTIICVPNFVASNYQTPAL